MPTTSERATNDNNDGSETYDTIVPLFPENTENEEQRIGSTIDGMGRQIVDRAARHFLIR